MTKRVLVPDHPDTVLSCTNLAAWKAELANVAFPV